MSETSVPVVRPFDWVAAALLVILGVLAFANLPLKKALWIGLLLIYAAVWLAMAITLFCTLAEASRRDISPWRRWRLALSVPLAVSVGFLLQPWLAAAGRTVFIGRFIDSNAVAFAADPSALTYIEGIPDGGIAVVRSHNADPQQLSQATQVDLTGERFRYCHAVRPDYYLCGYD